MSTLTENYKLIKPDQTDAIDISNLNDNADIIDTTLFNKVDKVNGKALSTNDYTNTDKQKVNTIDNKVDKEDGKGLSTNDYTDEDKDAVGSIINKIDKIDGKGLSTNDYTDEDKDAVNTIGNKVDKEEGKVLSTNDYTNEDKEKLNSLSNYIHPDTHLASMIVFEDGETLQEKFNKNTLFTPAETTQP